MRFGRCGLVEDEEEVEEVESKGRVEFAFIFGNVAANKDGVGEAFLESVVDFGFKEAKVVVLGSLLTGGTDIDILIGLANVPLAGLLTCRDISAGGGARTRGLFRGRPRFFGHTPPFTPFSLRLYIRFCFFISDSSSLEKLSSSSSLSKISGAFEVKTVGIEDLNNLEDGPVR